MILNVDWNHMIIRISVLYKDAGVDDFGSEANPN